MEGGIIMKYNYEVTISLPYTNNVLYRVCSNIVEALDVWEALKMLASEGETISLDVYLEGALVRSYVAKM